MISWLRSKKERFHIRHSVCAVVIQLKTNSNHVLNFTENKIQIFIHSLITVLFATIDHLETQALFNPSPSRRNY